MSVRTLTQHARRGSMAAQCLCRGLDTPLTSEHIKQKVAVSDLFSIYRWGRASRPHRCVPNWNAPNITYSPAASKQPRAASVSAPTSGMAFLSGAAISISELGGIVCADE